MASRKGRQYHGAYSLAYGLKKTITPQLGIRGRCQADLWRCRLHQRQCRGHMCTRYCLLVSVFGNIHYIVDVMQHGIVCITLYIVAQTHLVAMLEQIDIGVIFHDLLLRLLV